MSSQPGRPDANKTLISSPGVVINPTNCTLIIVLPNRILKHPLIELDDDALALFVAGAVFLVPNAANGLPDMTKIPMEKLAGCHSLADVEAVFKAVGVRRL
jgi:hypothetical protein